MLPLLLLSSALAQDTTKDMIHASAPELAESSGRWALIIGVDDYKDPAIQDLRFAANDANAMARALIDSGAWRSDQVIVMTPDAPEKNRKPTRTNILEQLAAIEGHPDLDTVLIYFSGHGSAEVRGDDAHNYLFPADVSLSVPEDTAIEVRRVLQALQRSGAKRKVAIFDACRNQLRVDDKALGGSAWSDVAYQEAEGTVLVYGTRFGDVSFEDEEANLGALTRYLVAGLEGSADGAMGTLPDGVVGIGEAYRYAWQSLQSRTFNGQVQTPMLAGEMGGADLAMTPVRDQSCPFQSSAELRAEGVRAISGWNVGQRDAFLASGLRTERGAACLRDPADREDAQVWHEVQALRAWDRQDAELTEQHLRGARDAGVGDPLQHTVADASLRSFAATVVDRDTKTGDAGALPEGVSLVVDGRRGDALPLDRPALVQAVTCEGDVVWTGALAPGATLPGLAGVPGGCRPPLRRPLLVSAAAATLATGGLWVATAASYQAFNTASEPPPSDENQTADSLRARARTTNALGFAAQGLTVASAGLWLGWGLTF